MTTCRICKKQEGRMIKYSTRHYAHGRCGIVKFGSEFMNMIPAHMIGQIPASALEDAGLTEEAMRRIEAQSA